jgi:exonuclease 3'-5' domain-containing protein 1
MMVQVIEDNTDDEIVDQFDGLIDGLVGDKDRTTTGSVALDVEGVNLSRVGTVELVSLAFDGVLTDGEESVFLVDFGNSKGIDDTKRRRRIDMIKSLLECEHVEKIIRDCRMDCDALFHIHGIVLKNVHDTQVASIMS